MSRHRVITSLDIRVDFMSYLPTGSSLGTGGDIRCN